MQQLYNLMLDAKYLAKNKVEDVLESLTKELEDAKEAAKKKLEDLKDTDLNDLTGSLDQVTGSLATSAIGYATGFISNASSNIVSNIVPDFEECPPKTPEEAIALAIKEGNLKVKPGAIAIGKPPFNLETGIAQLEKQQQTLLIIDKRTTLLRRFAEVTVATIDIAKILLGVLKTNPLSAFPASEVAQKIQKYEVIVDIILYIIISIDNLVDILIDKIEILLEEMNKCLDEPVELSPEIVALRERIRISTPSKGNNFPEQDYRGYFLVLQEEMVNNIPLRNVEILQQGVVVAETDKTFASSVEVIFQEARLQVDRLLK